MSLDVALENHSGATMSHRSWKLVDVKTMPVCRLTALYNVYVTSSVKTQLMEEQTVFPISTFLKISIDCFKMVLNGRQVFSADAHKLVCDKKSKI